MGVNNRLPDDLRDAVLKVAGTASDDYVGRAFGISKATVQKIRSKARIEAFRNKHRRMKEEELSPDFNSIIVQRQWEPHRLLQKQLSYPRPEGMDEHLKEIDDAKRRIRNKRRRYVKGQRSA